MKNLLAGIAVVLAFVPFATATKTATKNPTVYIQAPNGFDTDLMAALQKKHTPVTIVEDKKAAQYVLSAASVEDHAEPGLSQIARCAFALCMGAAGNSSVSVTLTRQNDSAIVWAYQVRKPVSGPMARQSLSEAIAKHLKDYLKKQK